VALVNEILQRFGLDRSIASEISSAVKRFKPVFKYGLKVNDLDLTADELEAALGGSDSGSTVTGITAYAGGGQANATALTGSVNVVETIATDGDSVKLPAASVGTRVIVINADGSGSNSLAIFPATGDKINGGSTNASVTMYYGQRAEFVATDSTNWYAEPGGVSTGYVSGISFNATTGLSAGYSGSSGVVAVYPPTAAKGYFSLQANDNAGDTQTDIRVAAQAGARSINLLDWSTKASNDGEVSIAGIKVVADTTNRPGALGCLLFATGNSKLYVCTTASATAATWTIVGSQS
jgi:hypothetical protein